MVTESILDNSSASDRRINNLFIDRRYQSEHANRRNNFTDRRRPHNAKKRKAYDAKYI
jgi:hypothetical protein